MPPPQSASNLNDSSSQLLLVLHIIINDRPLRPGFRLLLRRCLWDKEFHFRIPASVAGLPFAAIPAAVSPDLPQGVPILCCTGRSVGGARRPSPVRRFDIVPVRQVIVVHAAAEVHPLAAHCCKTHCVRSYGIPPCAHLMPGGFDAVADR